MKSKMIGSGILVVASVLLPVQAQGATGTASISGLKFELVDLDTSDGVAPSISWLSPQTSLYASAQTGSQLHWYGAGQWNFEFPNQLPAVGLSNDQFFLPTMNASSGGTTSQISSSGLGVISRSAANGGSGSGSVSTYGAFTLSAMTELRVTGVFNLNVAGPAGSGFTPPTDAAADYATLFSQGLGYVSVGLNPVAGGTVNTLTSSDSASLNEQNYTLSTDASLRTAAFDQSISGKNFALNLTNNSHDALSGQFYGSAVASVQQGAAAVPEPSTFVLTATGLVAVMLCVVRGHHSCSA